MVAGRINIIEDNLDLSITVFFYLCFRQKKIDVESLFQSIYGDVIILNTARKMEIISRKNQKEKNTQGANRKVL